MADSEETLKEQVAEQIKKGICPVCSRALYFECNGPAKHLRDKAIADAKRRV